jgi:hypothetical protein
MFFSNTMTNSTGQSGLAPACDGFGSPCITDSGCNPIYGVDWYVGPNTNIWQTLTCTYNYASPIHY